VVNGTASSVGGVTQAAAPVVDTTTATVGGVTQAAAPVVDSTTASVGGVTQAAGAGQPAAVVDVATGTAASAGGGAVREVADAAGSTLAGAADAAGAGTVSRLGDGADGGLDATATAAGAHGDVADAVASVAVPLAPAPAPGFAGTPEVDSTTAAFTQAAAVPPVPGVAGDGGSTADTIAQLATDPRLLAVTGITALAGRAYVVARSARCVAGDDGGVILNNVRLIPCLVRSGVSSGGVALGVVGSGFRQAAGAVNSSGAVLGERLSKTAGAARQDLAEHVVDPFRQGFGRATGQAPAGEARGGDVLFVGIGVVIGLLCAVLMSLWLLVAGVRQGTRA
jgi:hypothetical protein